MTIITQTLKSLYEAMPLVSMESQVPYLARERFADFIGCDLHEIELHGVVEDGGFFFVAHEIDSDLYCAQSYVWADEQAESLAA